MEGGANGKERRVEVAAADRRPRLVVVMIALAVLAAAVAVVLSTSGDEPPVIRLAADAGADGDLRATAETTADVATDELTIWNPVLHRFELSDGARIDAGRAPAWQLAAPGDLKAAANRLADRFGLGAVGPAPYDASSLMSGPEDGSGPTLWVGPNGDWSYSDPTGFVVWDCPAVEIDPPADAEVDDSSAQDRRELIAECPTPEPPTGVPSASEARERATSLFADLDLPGEVVLADGHSDEWGAWVQGTIQLDGVPTDLWVSAGWGGDALLTSASGTLAEPTRVEDYPTIDAGAAIERLEAGYAGWAGGSLRTLPAPAVELDSTESAPADQDRAVAADDPDAPVSDSGELATDDGEGSLVHDEPLPSPMPVEPVPEPGEVEEVTVTLTDVERILMLQVDADGAFWLLPGYRFTDADGGTWQVLAIADEYLEQPETREPEPLPDEQEPGAVEPSEPDEGAGSDPDTGAGEPGSVEPSEPDEGGEVIAEPEPGADTDLAQALAEAVVGLPEDEATARITGSGLEVRVVARDGERFAVTDDLRFDRVNLEVEDGTVVSAAIG